MENSILDFKDWLRNEKKIINVLTVESIIEDFKEASEFAIKMKYTKMNLTAIKLPYQFEMLSDKIRRNIFFSMKDKLSKGGISQALNLYYQYLCFINQRQNLNDDSPKNVEIKVSSVEINDSIGQTHKQQKNQVESFMNWLKGKGYTETASTSYISKIKSIDDLCMEEKLTDISLINITSVKEFDQIAKSIFENRVFKYANNVANNKYTLVLDDYRKFLNYYESNNEYYDLNFESEISKHSEKTDANLNNDIKDIFKLNCLLFEAFCRETVLSKLDKVATGNAFEIFGLYCSKKGIHSMSDLMGFDFKNRSFVSKLSVYKAELLENYWVWYRKRFLLDTNLKSNRELDYKQNKSKNMDSICGTTVKEALIEFSNNYKGEIKTRVEIVEELSAKYGHNEYSIFPADYEIGLSNSQPKLFKRIDHGAYLCLGYDAAQTGITALSQTQVDGYSLTSVDEKSKLIVKLSIFLDTFFSSSNLCKLCIM